MNAVMQPDQNPGGSCVSLARHGDAAACRALFERDRGMVYRIAYRILLHREEALEVVQDSFAAAFAHLHELREDGGWGAWLRTIAVRRALSRARTGRRWLRWFGWPDPDAELPERPVAVERLEEYELRRSLRDALAGLPARQRAVATLALEEGLSGAQIAAALDMREGTVKVHLHRARLHLREALKHFLPDA